MAQKRHHYVPQFWLKRFARDPGADNAKIVCLDKETGKIRTSGVRNEAVVSRYYEVTGIPDLEPNAVEDLLATVEGDAHGISQKLIDGQPISGYERRAFSLFVGLQQQRTPLGRDWRAGFYAAFRQQMLEFGVSRPEMVRWYFEEHPDELPPEGIEAWQRTVLGALREGKIAVEPTQNGEIQLMLKSAEEGAAVVATETSWTGLRAPAGSEYILSDHPLAFYDPATGLERGVAWLSSPSVQASIPLSPSFCLMFTPGPAIYREVQAGADLVRDINLRTYAWGQWCVYGTSQAVLQRVREHAKHNKLDLALRGPKPPRFTILERNEGEPTPHLM